MVKEGNPQKIHSYADIKTNPKLKLGVVAGTVEIGYAKALGIPDSQVVILSDNPSGMAAVRTGRVDAYAGTALTIARLGKQVPGVEAATPFKDPLIDGTIIAGYGGFGFHPNDKALRDAFDKVLMKYIGSEAWLKAFEPHGFGLHTKPNKKRIELCGEAQTQ